MQFGDFFNAGGGWVDTVKIVLFKMLPRGAQIEKVRAEINRGLLTKYGKITKLDIDNATKTITVELDLKGEKERVQITLPKYRLTQAEAGNPLFEPGPIEVSREWLNAVLKTLLQMGVLPERIEVRNPLHQTVVKSIL